MVVVRELEGVAVRADERGGDGPVWFEALYRSHYADVLQYARRRVSVAEADDVVAEVFTTAWRRRHEVDEIDRPWLLRTASHYLLHAYRGAARRDRLFQRRGLLAANRKAASVQGIDAIAGVMLREWLQDHVMAIRTAISLRT